MIEIVAPAKINLFLHVGPVRGDGLHALASLFAFAADGDRVSAAPANELSVSVRGPFAAALAGAPLKSNLVWRAAELLRDAARIDQGAALTLDKRLPIAAGLGGGSSDAAAALRALVRLWRVAIGEGALADLAFRLGADVPACLARTAVYVGGAGESVRRAPRLPPLWACLVNPRVATPTGPIFRAFDRANPAPRPPQWPARRLIADYQILRAWLGAARNDLEPHAVAREPAIGAAREFLRDRPGSLLARMSGSGATVFGLFASRAGADRAARAASAKGWWSMAAAIV